MERKPFKKSWLARIPATWEYRKTYCFSLYLKWLQKEWRLSHVCNTNTCLWHLVSQISWLRRLKLLPLLCFTANRWNQQHTYILFKASKQLSVEYLYRMDVVLGSPQNLKKLKYRSLLKYILIGAFVCLRRQMQVPEKTKKGRWLSWSWRYRWFVCRSSCLTWVPGTKLRSSGRAINVLKCSPINGIFKLIYK